MVCLLTYVCNQFIFLSNFHYPHKVQCFQLPLDGYQVVYMALFVHYNMILLYLKPKKTLLYYYSFSYNHFCNSTVT